MDIFDWELREMSPSVLDNKFVVIISCFNAEDTIAEAIKSVLDQDFDDIGIIIRNDKSTDHTDKCIRDVFAVDDQTENLQLKNKTRDILYIQNHQKLFAGGNTYESVLQFITNPYTIVGFVDGDDYLINQSAVTIMYNAYQDNPAKWLIWSQHVSKDQEKIGGVGYSRPLPADQVIYAGRNYWAVSHFRTCLAGLFSLIDREEFLDPKDPTQYAKVCGDASFLYPMMEMCGNRRSLFLNQLLYYYNDGIPTNDYQVYRHEIEYYRSYFENRKMYKQLAPDFKF